MVPLQMPLPRPFSPTLKARTFEFDFSRVHRSLRLGIENVAQIDWRMDSR